MSAETSYPVTRTAIIGCGGMARNHIRKILEDPRGTSIGVVCEPMAENYAAAVQLFENVGQKAPPNVADLQTCLDTHKQNLDAVFIVTPHSMHFDHCMMCLEAGLEVLVEKPMVVNQIQARQLMAKREETGKLLVVAFQGSLSPQIRWASKRIQDGTFGELRAISGTVWQDWNTLGEGKWRSDPKVSGGGFMFDTGAHIMNTIADLAGQDFVEVAAWLNNRGRPIDIMAAVMARLENGAYVTINGCGHSVPSCSSDIRVFTEKATVRACMWGRWLEVQMAGESDFKPVELPAMNTTWHRFLEVRHGNIDNPSPPEVGLRMLKLWDAIKDSASKGGQKVLC